MFTKLMQGDTARRACAIDLKCSVLFAAGLRRTHRPDSSLRHDLIFYLPAFARGLI
jgi:hypothetical protein